MFRASFLTILLEINELLVETVVGQSVQHFLFCLGKTFVPGERAMVMVSSKVQHLSGVAVLEVLHHCTVQDVLG